MRHLVAISVAWLVAGSGQALAATCSFDEASGVMSVSDLSARPFDSTTLEVVGGAIEVDGAACGAATTTSTSRIVITGEGGRKDDVTLIGSFAPGRNDVPETDTPEIEIDIANFTEGNDRLAIEGSNQTEVWRFTAGGVNLNGDLDEDINVPKFGRVSLAAGNGQDTIDASAYTGNAFLSLRGGGGGDQITGSAAADEVLGGPGNDSIYGRGGDDHIYDGTGDDLVRAGPGDDVIYGDADADNGADDIRGNAGIDIVTYYTRDIGITVTLDDVADDGQAGEGDNIHADVEDLRGGWGDDVLVGSSEANYLAGGFGGDDTLRGGAGDDLLSGSSGRNSLYGGPGNDVLEGKFGRDFLYGGTGDDVLDGADGNDVLDGGAGIDQYLGGDGDDDFFNADGLAETIDCGDGIDDAEPDPLDTFVGCEDI